MSEPNTAAPKKSKKGFLMIVLLVVLGGGGAGGYFYFLKASPAGAHGEAAEPEPEAEHKPATGTGIVPMEPFVVNLADPGAIRFLRVNLSLVVKDEEVAKEMEENAVDKARIRSAILELLAMQHSEAIVTPEGKDELKTLIAERSEHAAHELKVVDVLFSEFVIQF